MTKTTFLSLALASISAAAGQLLFKIGADGQHKWMDFFNSQIFLGILFYGLGTALWIYALSFEKLVNVYAFTALTFVLVYLGGVFLLNERLSPQASIGICLILGGLYLIAKHNI